MGANSTSAAVQDQPTPGLPLVSARYIWLLVLGQFGVFIAFMTPVAISLAIRVQDLAPDRDEYLGYITGSGAAAVMFTAPLVGILSDRTRTRMGRRRPYMIGGMAVGVLSLVVMALAPSVLVLGFGWLLAQLGWGTVLGSLQISAADRLPESQRGKVSGLAGLATQAAPVLGVMIAGGLAGNSVLLFLVPGIIGVLLVTLFVVFVPEEDTRGAVFPDRLTVGTVFARFLFNPLTQVDFALAWLGRFLFYVGLTLATTFTAFFFATRLDMTLTEVAGIVAAVGAASVLAVTIGALGAGLLSDRLKRRRLFVLIGALVFCGGVLLQAFSSTAPMLFAGSLLASVGIGAYSAVDQALLLDVLPHRELEAGRFMGITGFATSIPQALAPFIAPLILGVGGGPEKNYTLLYTVAAASVLVGGLVVLRIRSVR